MAAAAQTRDEAEQKNFALSRTRPFA